MLRVHILQHVVFEHEGLISKWLEENQAIVSRTLFFEDHSLPDLSEFDFLIVMGGPMGVQDVDTYQFILEESEFIRKAIDSGKKILGICLGAQLIAQCLGAKVFPNVEKEIGWFPIECSNEGALNPDRGSEQLVFHWHGDTFDLPKGAKLLASSPVCENQAFQIGENILGLQFHLECGFEEATKMVEHGRDELVKSTWIQDEKTIVSPESKWIQLNEKTLRFLLDGLLNHC